MNLYWSTPHELAAALQAAHPTADRLNLSDADLIKLATALPDFRDKAQPDRDTLHTVLQAWFDLDGEDEAQVSSGDID